MFQSPQVHPNNVPPSGAGNADPPHPNPNHPQKDVFGVFAVVTVATMLAAVTLGQIGLERLKIPALARFGHTTAGAAMLGCGVAIGWMGL